MPLFPDGSKLAQEAVKPKKGFLRGFFEFLDLPGNVIQNLLVKGNYEGALRNVADLATGLSGVRMLPGMWNKLELSRDKEDRPDIGFLGEVLLDPLFFVGLPSNLAKNIGKQVGKRMALKATTRALTPAGLKALSAHTLTTVAPKIAKSKAFQKLAKRVAKRKFYRGVAFKTGKEAVESLTKQLASRRATREVTRGVLGGKLPSFLAGIKEPLVEGGIKLGLPFTTGKTVALKGTDVLRSAAKYSVPGAAYSAAKPYIGEQVKAAVRWAIPTAFMGKGGKNIVATMKNVEGAMKSKWQSRIRDAVEWLPEDLSKQVSIAIGKKDSKRAVPALLATLDAPTRKRLTESLGKYRQIMGEMADEMASQGLIRNREALPAWYFPTQLLDVDEADDFVKMFAPAPDDAAKVGYRGANIPYTKDKVFEDIEEFIEGMAQKGREPELDLLKASLKRAGAQSWLISRAQAIRQSNKLFGLPGKGAEAAQELSRLMHGGKTARGTSPLGRFESITMREAARRTAQTGAQADEAMRALRELGPQRIPGAAPHTAGLRATAQKAAGARANQVKQVIASTNKFIPKKLRKHFTQSMAADGTHAVIGFTKRGGNFRKGMKATLVRASDGVYELVDLPSGANRARMAAAAERFAVMNGVQVRMTDALSKRFLPHLRSLADKELENYLRLGAGKIKRSPFLDVLEKNPYMRAFRTGVTVGLGPFVNVAFATRNIMTGFFQAATDPQLGLVGFKHLRPILEGLMDKVGRRLGLKVKGGNVFKMLAENALQQGDDIGRVVSGIDDVRIGNYTGREVLALANKHAVTRQGYTGIEAIVDVARKGKGRIPKWATEANEYVENAMRLNSYSEMLGKGIDPFEAGKAVSRAFVDYRYQGNVDRSIRALFPFSRFTMAQTPRTLEATMRMPAIAQPLRALMAGGIGSMTPAWLADAPNIPLGTTPEGKQRVLARTGLPFEDLSVLGTGEGAARTVEQGLLARLHPFLRIPLEATVGKSFWKGQPFGRSVRAPMAMPDVLAQALGGKVLPKEKGGTRLPWQMDQAFRALPVSRQVNEIGKLLDDRKDIWAKSMDFIAGAKIYDIDEDRELKRLLRDYLVTQAQAGNIGKVERFFSYGDTDEELTALLKAYYKIGKGTGKRGTKPPQQKSTS